MAQYKGGERGGLKTDEERLKRSELRTSPFRPCLSRSVYWGVATSPLTVPMERYL